MARAHVTGPRFDNWVWRRRRPCLYTKPAGRAVSFVPKTLCAATRRTKTERRVSSTTGFSISFSGCDVRDGKLWEVNVLLQPSGHFDQIGKPAGTVFGAIPRDSFTNCGNAFRRSDGIVRIGRIVSRPVWHFTGRNCRTDSNPSPGDADDRKISIDSAAILDLNRSQQREQRSPAR